jgi:hypothetical protein
MDDQTLETAYYKACEIIKQRDETIQSQSRLIEGKQRAIAQYCKERDDLFERNQQLKEALKWAIDTMDGQWGLLDILSQKNGIEPASFNYIKDEIDKARKLLEK